MVYEYFLTCHFLVRKGGVLNAKSFFHSIKKRHPNNLSFEGTPKAEFEEIGYPIQYSNPVDLMQDAALIKSKVIILFKSVMVGHLTVSILREYLQMTRKGTKKQTKSKLNNL